MGGRMADEPNVRAGDWVRFYRNGKLVIGAVDYVYNKSVYPYGLEAATDRGTVLCKDVLEVRRKRNA